MLSNLSSFRLSVQNGAVAQKETLNDDEFEPYLNAQPRQVGPVTHPHNRGSLETQMVTQLL